MFVVFSGSVSSRVTSVFGLDARTLGLIVSVAGLLLGVAASSHVLLNKRRPESAFGWVGVCLLLPIAGPLLYYVFGINRVRTRATKLRPGSDQSAADALIEETRACAASVQIARVGDQGIARSGAHVGAGPLVAANLVRPLHNGEEAFPEMLRAIAGARRRVLLSTYIFESNESGMAFVDALAEAVERGVEVRVLLDGVGELYSWPRLRRILRRRGVPYARFLPPRVIPPAFRINLRNHRKILCADGRVAFVGGINIGDRHLADRVHNPRRVVDLHFRVDGPVARQTEAVFLRDWDFASGERLAPLEPESESAMASTQGAVPGTNPCWCRTLADGPDEDIDRLVALLLAAIGAAEKRVYIMTPYFLPPRELIGALQAAALRGLDVSIILPEQNNLPYVHRATRHMLWELLRRDVKVYLQPPPFVHSKMLVVDDGYTQVGSANWDARSLRLNFELALEVFNDGLTAEMAEHFEQTRAQSKPVRLADITDRTFGTKLVDGVCWLMGPYL